MFHVRTGKSSCCRAGFVWERSSFLAVSLQLIRRWSVVFVEKASAPGNPSACLFFKKKKIQVAVSSHPTGNWLHASMWWLVKALNSKEENLWTFGVAAKGSQGSRSERLGRLRLFTAQDTKTGQLTIWLNMLMTRFHLLFVSDKPLLLYHRCWV